MIGKITSISSLSGSFLFFAFIELYSNKVLGSYIGFVNSFDRNNHRTKMWNLLSNVFPKWLKWAIIGYLQDTFGLLYSTAFIKIHVLCFLYMFICFKISFNHCLDLTYVLLLNLKIALSSISNTNYPGYSELAIVTDRQTNRIAKS